MTNRINVEQLKNHLGISKETIYRMVKKKHFAVHFHDGWAYHLRQLSDAISIAKSYLRDQYRVGCLGYDKLPIIKKIEIFEESSQFKIIVEDTGQMNYFMKELW